MFTLVFTPRRSPLRSPIAGEADYGEQAPDDHERPSAERASTVLGRDTQRAMPEESTTPDLVELTSRQLEAANRGDLDAL